MRQAVSKKGNTLLRKLSEIHLIFRVKVISKTDMMNAYLKHKGRMNID